MLEGTAVTFPSDGLTLEGLVHLPGSSPAPGVVICHPHPLYGGDMYNNVVGALVRTALSSGLAALRFHFRGAGGSEGSFDNGIGEQSDVADAVAFLRSRPEIDPGRIALAGYSFGAAVALAAAAHLSDIAALVCVSTPTRGGYVRSADASRPVLFLSGDRDEYADPAALRRLAGPLGERAQLVLLPGVDHFWWGSDDRLAETVSAFFARTLSVPSPGPGGQASA